MTRRVSKPFSFCPAPLVSSDEGSLRSSSPPITQNEGRGPFVPNATPSSTISSMHTTTLLLKKSYGGSLPQGSPSVSFFEQQFDTKVRACPSSLHPFFWTRMRGHALSFASHSFWHEGVEGEGMSLRCVTFQRDGEGPALYCVTLFVRQPLLMTLYIHYHSS